MVGQIDARNLMEASIANLEGVWLCQGYDLETVKLTGTTHPHLMISVGTSPGMFRTILKLLTALAMVGVVSSAVAQQRPVAQEPSGITAQQTAPASPPAVASPSALSPAAPSATAIAGESPTPLKSTTVALRELSPWSRFMSADIIVKAVMIGLAFASLVTWTIFIAKMIELTVVQGKLRRALSKIGEARSLAEAQFALGAKEGVLPSLLAAAMREGRMSAGISSDAGIKERAASSFAEIVRAEARRVRF